MMQSTAYFVLAHDHIGEKITAFAHEFNENDRHAIVGAHDYVKKNGLNVQAIKYKFERNEAGDKILISYHYEFRIR